MTINTSIIIPAFNEAARLATGYERLRPTLEVMSLETTEVIVVDDGSTDDTLHIAHDVFGHLPNVLFVQQPMNLGKGAAVRTGIAVARGRYVIAADADMSINPHHFPDFVEALHEYPLVPGSRAQGGRIHYESALRTFAGGAFNRLVRHYTGTRIRDTQCGAKGYQLGAARVLALLGMINRFAFDAENFYLANQLGLNVHPLPVTWADVMGSSVRVGRDSLAMIRDLRAIPRTPYENPVIELARDVDAAAVNLAARQARAQGLAIARGDTNTLVVLARDGALAGLSIASDLGGELRTAKLAELKERSYEAV